MNFIYILSEQSLTFLFYGHFLLAFVVFLREYFRKKSVFNINSIFWIVASFMVPYLASIFYLLGTLFSNSEVERV